MQGRLELLGKSYPPFSMGDIQSLRLQVTGVLDSINKALPMLICPPNPKSISLWVLESNFILEADGAGLILTVQLPLGLQALIISFSK